ncbi:MAG TPA: hypothetical protein VIV11_06950 [Kofleriaceae bacterium]
MRWLFLLAACSCASSPSEQASSIADPSAVPAKVFATAQDPWASPAPAPVATPQVFGAPISLAGGTTTVLPVSVPVSGRVITSIHASVIVALAVTEDARVAISADAVRSVRLWPSLDGKHEPVVVEMRAPAALALARSGTELIAAGLDEAGQLELVKLTASGEAVKRLTIDTARPLLAIHATPSAFIALRDDRAITAVDFVGGSRGVLVAEPGEHIAAIAVRSGLVLAMIDRDGEVRGRWVEPGALRWGAYTPALAIKPDHVALSPDTKRAAGIARDGKAFAIVDLATERTLARPFKSAKPRMDRARPIGFVSNTTLAITFAGNDLTWVSWMDGTNKRADIEGNGDAAFAAVDGRVIAGANGALAIARPEEGPQFVGYRMGGPASLRSVGDRYLATDGTSVVELDRRFRTRLVYELPGEYKDYWYGIHILDATHVIGTTQTKNGHAPFLVDLSAATATSVKGTPLAYEPSTGILAYPSKEEGIELVAYDAATGTLGPPVEFTTNIVGRAEVKLLDPKLADGHVAALASDDNGDGVALLTLIRRAKPATFEITEQKDVKRAADLASLLDRRFPRSARAANGSLTAVLRDSRITLRDAHGVERWTIAAAGATALLWTPSGELVAYGAGIARFDLATGAILDRQCGWRFGLWDSQPFVFGAAGLCEAP